MPNFYFFHQAFPGTYWRVTANDEEAAWDILYSGEREIEFMGLAGIDDQDITENMIIHEV